MWASHPLAELEAMASEIERRFGAPSGTNLDSNGHGPFDAHLLRWACGLEVALWRFHLDPDGHAHDPATQPSTYEIHANQPDVAHIASPTTRPARTS